MPIYEYTCSACGKDFEQLVRGSDPAPACPSCQSTDLRKKLSTFAAMSDAAAPSRDLPSPCGSCGHPDGPGACQFR